MRNQREHRGLAATLATGMKDIPRNASWVVGKALSTHEATDGAGASGPTLGDAVRQAGWSLRGALPGQDSVEARLEKARIAADRARAAEEAAFEAAQAAHDRSVAADEMAEEERARLDDVEAREADKVEQRLEEARRRAEEMVAEERRSAEADAAAVLEEERRASDDRVARARPASEAAEQARLQAEQVADDARRGAEEATQAVTRAEELRASTATTAKTVVRGVSAKENPQRLKDLNKAELLKLAAAQGIEGRTSKTKQQLIAALHGAARRSPEG
jgi:hypothetical protein